MDNKHFPPLESENTLPEVLPDIPQRMEPLEELPFIEELSFEEEPSEPELQRAPEESPLSEIPPEEPVIDELSFREEPLQMEESVSVEEPLPIEEPLPVAETLPVGEPQSVEEPVIAEDNTFPVESPIPEQDFDDSFFAAIPEKPETAEAQPDMEVPVIPAQDPVATTSEAEPYPLPDTQDMDLSIPEEEIPDQAYQDDDMDFEAIMQQAAPQPKKEQPTSPAMMPKARPKRKKGDGLLGIPSILVTFVWLALIVVIGVTAGRMLWICAADVLAFGREDQVVTVTVYEADTMEDIIDKLYDAGLIRYKSLFRLYADISDAQEDIKPGIYDLNTRYDYHALVNFMSPRSSREVIKVTIPEGYTCRQIFSLLEENRICTAVDAAAYASSGELPGYWFLEGLERGSDNCLEGYLFPDTYEFYKNSTPREAIERMLDNFDNRFDEEMFAQLETLNQKVTDGSYGIREIVIIASLIEKESAAPGESPRVSGVIYNRLFNWGNNPPYLNIDASIVYAQEGQNQRIDTSLESPYNTYLYEGLTPGPIANPGLSSLKAALNPESHNYYYYVLNPSTGMHQFSTTYEEHTGYVRQFAAATEDE